MSQPVVIRTRHRLGAAALKQRIDARVAALQAGPLAKVADVRMRWEGDTANIHAKALGAKAECVIAVTDTDLAITIYLPRILMPFRAAIVALVNEQEDVVRGDP